MKSIKYLAAFVVMMLALAGCNDLNSPKNAFEQAADDPSSLITYKVVFSNQSTDPYAVVVQNSDGVDQFDIEGNKSETRNYPAGKYNVKLTQKSGYTFYASKFEFVLTITSSGKTVSWDNKSYNVK